MLIFRLQVRDSLGVNMLMPQTESVTFCLASFNKSKKKFVW